MATPNGAKISAPRAVTLPAAGIGLVQPPTTKNFVIRNAGKPGNLIGNLTISQPGSAFNITTSSTFNLAPRAISTVTVTYQPSATTDSAMLMINSNDATRGMFQVNLKGRGFTGKLSVPASFTIRGSVGTPTPANLTIKNTGKGLLTGSFPSLTSSPGAPYDVTGAPFSLQPRTSTTIPITFTAPVKGRAPTATLTISVDSPSTGSRTVTLRGIGN